MPDHPGASEVPACLMALIGVRSRTPQASGESGAAVYRLHGGNEGDLYLKYGRGPIADDVTDEMTRLRWLAGRLPVPAVRGFFALPDEAWLLTDAIPGRPAYDLLANEPDQRPAVVDALARFLLHLHALPVEECPFDSGHFLRLTHARKRLEAGLVDTDDFDEDRQGWTADMVWDGMTRMLPITADPVVTHGDFSLDNILLQEGEVTGCIDVGRAGIADRYQDIAILWNCLGEFGPNLQRRFLHAYGIDRLDERKLRFHLMLDEFF